MALDFTNLEADVIDLVTDLSSAEINSFANAIEEGKQDLSTFEQSTSHTVLNGVRNGNLLPILNSQANPDSFGFMDDTNCVTPECDIVVDGKTHKWELGLIGCQVPICMGQFGDNFKAWFGMNKQIFTEEEQLSNIVVSYLRDRFQRDFNIAKWRVAYFGDKADASTLLNGFDGFFTQAQALQPANVIPITQNAAVDYPTQLNTMTGLDVYNYLVEMHNTMMSQYWNEGVLEYRMTKTTAQILANYVNDVKDKACCDGVERLSPDAVNTGQTTVNYAMMGFRGIPIRIVAEWDFLINGSTALNGGGGIAARKSPHRILLTYRNNLLVGTPDSGQLDSFDMWYDKTEDKVYMRAKAYLGAGIPLSDYILAI